MRNDDFVLKKLGSDGQYVASIFSKLKEKGSAFIGRYQFLQKEEEEEEESKKRNFTSLLCYVTTSYALIHFSRFKTEDGKGYNALGTLETDGISGLWEVGMHYILFILSFIFFPFPFSFSYLLFNLFLC